LILKCIFFYFILCLNKIKPYDQNYLNEHKIKHLSFHSYIRKLIAENKATSKNNKGYLPPLEDQDFKIKPNCSGHLPYPKGICSKCQPSAVTLQSQVIFKKIFFNYYY